MRELPRAREINVAERSVLIDGYQFLRANGTGIASYVRTLSSMLRSAVPTLVVPARLSA